jgi:ADP-ribosyltransferase exoenzyme
LEEAGVAIYKLISNAGEEIYLAIYKDEVIAKGAAKEVRDILKEIWEERVLEKMMELLDELFDLSILSKNEDFLKILAIVKKKPKLSKYLTIEEEAVIKYYTTSAYENLNKALRGLIKMTPEYAAFKNLLSKALNKLPDSGYNLFYRSFKMSEENIKAIFIEGKTFTEKAFMSSTFDYDDFLRYWLRDNPAHNVLMKIQAKTGKNIQAVSEISEEAEAMFINGKEFDVISINTIDHPVSRNKTILEIILKEK